jgi:hypothetical protein
MTASSGHARSILRGHSMWPSQNRWFFSHKGKERPAAGEAAKSSPPRRGGTKHLSTKKEEKKRCGPQGRR